MSRNLSLLFALTVALLWPQFSFAYYVQTTIPTNIRKLPGQKYGLVVKVPKKSRLEVLARNNSTDIKGKKSWLKVRTEAGQEGWVGTWLVKYVKEAMAQPMDSGMNLPPLDAPPADGGMAAPDAGSAPAPAEPSTPPADSGAGTGNNSSMPDIEILDSVNDADLQ